MKNILINISANTIEILSAINNKLIQKITNITSLFNNNDLEILLKYEESTVTLKYELIQGVSIDGITYTAPISYENLLIQLQTIVVIGSITYSGNTPAGSGTSSSIPATSLNQINQKNVLDNILLELKDDINATETIWYDKITPTLFYVRRSSTNQDNGIVTISFYNIDGTIATPIIANLVQAISGIDYEFNSVEKLAITAGIGYSVNDSIQELQIINMTLGTLVNTIWVNKTTDALISAPNPNHLIIDDSYANKANQILANTKLDSILLNQINKTQSTKLTNGADDAQIQNTVVLGAEQGLVTRNITDDIASTKSKQNEQINILDNIDVKLEKLDTSIIPFNVNVVNQSSNSTADSTAANQILEIAQLSIIQTNTNTLDTNLSTRASEATIAALNAKTPLIGQGLITTSSPVVLPLAQITTLTPPSNTGYALDTSVNSLLKPSSTLSTVTTLGTITNALPTGSNTIGNTNQTQATSGFSKITDGVNNAVVTTALPATATSGLVVRQAPDAAGNTQIIGATPLTAPNVKITNQSGSTTVSITGANISANTVDSALIVGLSPNSNKTGSEQGLGLPIGIVGSVVGGAVTTTAPTYINGNFNQLSLNTTGGLRVENNTTQINGQPVAIQNGILNNATQRVVLANRIETIVSNIGTLSDIPLTAGQRIKLLNHTNDTGVLFYLQIHNKATPLVTGDIPQSIIRVPANSTINEGAGFFGESGTLYGANTRIGYSSTFGTYTATASTNKSINIITVA